MNRIIVVAFTVFTGCLMLSIGTLGQHVVTTSSMASLESSELATVVGATQTDHCHWRCYRAFCGFEGYPCTTGTLTCPVTGRYTPQPNIVGAQCKAMTDKSCITSTEDVKPYYCRLTGQQNSFECMNDTPYTECEDVTLPDPPPEEHRCTVDHVWGPEDPNNNLATVSVEVETTSSDQCTGDKQEPYYGDSRVSCG